MRVDLSSRSCTSRNQLVFMNSIRGYNFKCLIIIKSSRMKDTKVKSPSRKETQPNSSYYGRYVQKSKNAQGQYQKSILVSGKKWDESEIIHRRDKIIDTLHKNHQTSIIRIEDSITNQLILRNIQPDTQSIWLSKITEIKEKLQNTHKKLLDGQRSIKQRQKELQEKKIKHSILIEKKEELRKSLQEIALQEEQQRFLISQASQELKNKQNQQEIKQLKDDQKVITNEVKEMEAKLMTLRQQYKKLETVEETEETVEDMNELVEENERIKQNITKLQSDNQTLEQQIRQLQNRSSPSQQIYRRFTQLYEKISIKKKLGKMEKLMQVKQQLLKRQEQYERNSFFLREKQKELDQREKKLQDKRKQLDKINDQIVQKSNSLLSIFHP